MLPYTIYNRGGSDEEIIVECERCYIHEVQRVMIEQGYCVSETIFVGADDNGPVFMRMWKFHVEDQE